MDLTFEWITDSRTPKRQALNARIPGQPLAIGTLTFGWGPGDGVIRTTNYWTHPEHLRRGVATRLAKELFRRYPQAEIVEGGGGNAEDGSGDALLESLRAAGLRYHREGCAVPRTGSHCQCGFPVRPVTPSGVTSSDS